MSENTTAALKVHYFRDCLIKRVTRNDIKFQVSQRGRVYFREDKLQFNLNEDYEPNSQIYVGDKVVVHSLLERPWCVNEPNETDEVKGPYHVVAFASMIGYINEATSVQNKATFCVLTESLDFDSSNPTPFLMVEDKIALFFAGALDVVG